MENESEEEELKIEPLPFTPSEEYQEKMSYLKAQEQVNSRIHQRAMKEMCYRRESERIRFEKELEVNRIKSAEIRKNFQRQQDLEFMKSYHKKQQTPQETQDRHGD